MTEGLTNEIEEIFNYSMPKVYIAKIFKNFLLMNHWPECIDIWHGASLGLGDSCLFK